MAIESLLEMFPEEKLENARRFRERMADFDNPVEFVNNMYGCHPNQKGGDYFQEIYK